MNDSETNKIYLALDDKETSRIKIDDENLINGNWKISSNLKVLDGDGVKTIYAVKGGVKDTCQSEKIEITNSSNEVIEEMNICVYSSRWKAKNGMYRFNAPQKSREDMLYEAGCDAYEDFDETESNIENNYYLYHTKYNRCGVETNNYIIYIGIGILLVLLILFIYKKFFRKRKFIQYKKK